MKVFLRCVLLPIALVFGAWPSATVTAQGTVAGNRGPRFFFVTAAKAAPVEISSASVLRRPVSASLNDVSLKDALDEIARQAGIKLVYSAENTPIARRVSLDAKGLTLAAALTQVLFDTGLDVVFSWNGPAAIMPKNLVGVARAKGNIQGRVTDAKNGTPIAGATVQIDGKPWRAMTDQEGKYRIGNVDGGEYLVIARRLGFTPVRHRVAVTEGGDVTADFMMVMVPTALTEVVTTATGERSRVEVGNNVGTIRADSVVATSLIRNMGDLLTARTPGVIVSGSNGLLGAQSFVRIRGQASVSLSSDPILVVDGVRMTPVSYGPGSASIGSYFVGGAGGTDRLGDIDPNTIESIDVLRGPSASSLYGTDAAAGVIVIKTKKGAVGSYRFNVLADAGTSRVPGTFPLQYVGFGHTPNGTPVAKCYLYQTTLANVVDHTCVQDSVRGYDFYSDPRLTELGTGTAQNVSANLSGGTEQLREFLSLRLSDAVGVGKLSAVEQDRVARMWGEAAPSWVRRPNAERNIAGASRTNLQAMYGLDLSLTANGIYRSTLATDNAGVVGVDPGGNGFARQLYDTLVFLPAENQRQEHVSVVKRGYISMAANYTPLSWLVLRGTLGGDYTHRTGNSLARAADCTAVLNLNGCSSSHGSGQQDVFVTTVDFGAQATWTPQSWLIFRTATGEQLNRTQSYDLEVSNSSSNLAFGTDLLTPSPVSTTTGAQLFSVSENRDASASAGWYMEETAMLRERLFLTAAFRQDVASAFGHNVNAKAPVYPKFSLSWLLSDEPFFPKTSVMSSLRLRTAYGHSGQEARQTAVLSQYTVTTTVVDGVVTPGIGLTNLGNPELRPERTAEWEGGFDLSLFANERVHLEATVYRKMSNDAISSLTIASSLGGNASFPVSGYLESVNLGKVENRGWELGATAKLLDGRMIGWDLMVNASHNMNRLVSSSITSLPANDRAGNFVGYPLQSYFGHVMTGYADFNGDGILEPGEVQFGLPLQYLGSVNPESELTYVNAVRLWGGAVQINANLDQVNGRATTGTAAIGSGNKLTSVQAYQPLSLATQAAWLQGEFMRNGSSLYIGKANTLRLAELSVTATVPPRVAARLLRVRTATVTLAGRNLALWTTSADKDPNMTGSIGAPSVGDPPTSVPPTRDFTIRLNLGY